MTTEDGYILTIFRIPGKDEKKKTAPILLQHTLFDNGGSWLFNNKSYALPYKLADEGYDIWIINQRGTIYSNKHKSMNINSDEYWDFSVHEISLYDLSSFI